MRIPIGWFFLFFFSTTAFATFLPPNDLWKDDRVNGFDQTTMTEAQFNQIIDKVVVAMEPSVKLHSAKLMVSRLWSNSTVNAMSTRFFNVWRVIMYGGLARRPEITPDGFTLVMCHEMGHHLGGFPFYSRIGSRWAASEGESDYYATYVCARKVWGDDKVENAKSRFTIGAYAKSKCDQVWGNQDDQNLCYRTAQGSESLAKLLQVLRREEKLDLSTPDKLVVKRTNKSYPSSQCRLDTYFSGALCGGAWDLRVIPGRRYFKFQSGQVVEEEAAKYSCFQGRSQVGYRPSCWFKQSIN